MTLSPKRIDRALKESKGSRKAAAAALEVSLDFLRKQMRLHEEDGHVFQSPAKGPGAAKTDLQPGQWAEWGRTQELCEVLQVERSKVLIRFDGGVELWVGRRELAWVPSGDVISDACREIQSKWTERDFGLRCWTERKKWFTPLISGVEDSRDDTW